ncbi:YlxR family protein [Rhodococcoides yunnanense]|uniref:YlxR family protein n=1 Tax=Rhodococcoides yunnanense TaxID=278209 RepID=UPI0014741ABB|nr:YlxR family protein [Rhodococcus yunnanensis]
MVRNELSVLSHESTGSTTESRPVRTCVGCKERVPASDLLRVVVRDRASAESKIVPDVGHRLPGRGAWLHPVPNCLQSAERRRAFGRALRVSGTVDTSEVVAFVEGRSSDMDQGDRATPVEKNRQQH